MMTSDTPTPWAIICPNHDQVFLTEEEYLRQLDFPDNGWICPICASGADYDIDNWEDKQDEVLDGGDQTHGNPGIVDDD